MSEGIFEVPAPRNESVLEYAPGSVEREGLTRQLAAAASECLDIPAIFGGREVRSGQTKPVCMPHDHRHVLANVHESRAEDVNAAIGTALEAGAKWREMPFEERAAIFLRAADLLAGPWRQRVNAACMLSQSKTCHQAEIDSACELIDFWRFNVHFARQIHQLQPISPAGFWNRTDYRPLEGFVLAVTPFNFLAIAGNLPTAPALMGNVVLWKPAHPTTYGGHLLMQLLREAGLPDGVISFLPGEGPAQGNAALDSEHLAGIHFTGSTATFRALWKGAAERLDRYRNVPRIVGETGGKDFIVAHPSANEDALLTAILRGGYEYQGQKCSAVSRVYVPKSMWMRLRDRMLAELQQMKMGDVRDFSNFLGAVIDERAFKKIGGYLEVAHKNGTILHGGRADGSRGWFVEPTLVEVSDPDHRLLQEEIFGPVVTVFPYDERRWSETLRLVDRTSPYGLTGAIFAESREAVLEASEQLRFSAGNFYINDKPTGAVVGQQPFGGARASGTNDKAGSFWNLTRWISPRSIKEAFVPATNWRYPFLQD